MEHLTDKDIKAKAKLKNYINHLEGTKRTQFKSSLKDLRMKGDSWEFISEMLFFKPLDVWDRYGYGLLFNKGYRTQVWNLMNAAFEEDEELDSLFNDEVEEEPEEETNDDEELISNEQLQEMKNSQEPFFYNRRGEAYTFNEVQSILSECPTPKDTFNLTWGRFPDSQEAICYYGEELSSMLGGF